MGNDMKISPRKWWIKKGHHKHILNLERGKSWGNDHHSLTGDITGKHGINSVGLIGISMVKLSGIRDNMRIYWKYNMNIVNM